MTTLIHHRSMIAGCVLLLLITSSTAAYFAQPAWLLLPVGFLCILRLFQKPEHLFYLLLFSIPWSVEFNFSSGLGTDLPDEPLMLLTALAALILVATFRKKFLGQSHFHPLLFYLALAFIWTGITVALSTHIVLSGKYLLAKSWYLLAFVVMPLFIWQNKAVLKKSILVLFISMLLVTSVALVRHAANGFTFSSINVALHPFFRNHVNYSALLVFMVPLQILFWQQAKSNYNRLIFLSFFITLPALYFSFARGAWLALLMGLIAYWLLKKRWLFKGFLVAVIISIALVLWLRSDDRYLQFSNDYQSTIFHENFEEHLTATYQLKDMSTAERFYRWIAGVRMIEDSWQTGFGPTTFYQHYKSYTVPAFKTWVSKNEEQSTVHNYFLLLIVEQGAIGLMLFLVLIGALFWYAQKIYYRTTNLFWKRTVAAIAAILVMQCTLNFLSDLIETDKVGSVFYLCIAALIVADRKTKNEGSINYSAVSNA